MKNTFFSRAVALLLVVGWLYMYMAAAVQYLDKW